MNDIKENLQELSEDIEEMVEKLKQERDELGVKLHLAKMEASEEWQELERKWSKLEAKVKQLGDAAAESTGDVRAAAELLGQEIKAGFKRITKQL
jgi:cytochrome c556